VTGLAEGNASAAVEAATGVAAVAETAVVHAETAEGVRAATAQQESACRMVAEATERLTGSAGELRSLVGGLRVAPVDAQTDDFSHPADPPTRRIPVPALFVPGEALDDELAPKRRRRRTVALS
jgi:hypothetical protein